MENQRKDDTIQTITRYSASKIYDQILKAFTAFIRPKLLPPELFGLWNILNLIPTYTSYIHLGSRSSMRYLIPYHEVREEQQTIREIKGSVYYGTMYLNILVVILLILFSFIGTPPFEVRSGIWTMGFIVMLGWYYEYYFSVLKGHQNFKLITSTNFLMASVTASLSILLILFLNIYGVYLTAILSHIAVVSYLKLKFPLEPQSKFRFRAFYGLVKQGFPIMIFSVIEELMRSSDRIIVSYFLGNTQLGYYGIASMVSSFVVQIPGGSREVIEPQLIQNAYKESKESNLNEYFFKPLIHTAYLMPFLIGPVILLIPVLIPLLLPKYLEGIIPTQINVLGSYFLSLAYVARGILIANHWQMRALVISSIVLVINLSLCIFLLKLGLGLNGVALGSSISCVLFFIGLLSFIRRNCRYALEEWRSNLIGICWPFPIMMSSLLLLNYSFQWIPITEPIAAFIKVLLFYSILLFMLKFAQKRFVHLKGLTLERLWQL